MSEKQECMLDGQRSPSEAQREAGVVNGIQAEAYELLSDGVLIYSTGKDGAYPLYANKAALRLMECESLEDMRDYCSGSYLNFFHPDDYRHHRDTISLAWASQENFDHHVQYRIVTKKGSIRRLNDSGKILEIPGYEKCYICVLSELDHQSSYTMGAADPLTGLLSMEQFIHYCESFLRKESSDAAESYHLAYFNIRRFKEYNVEFGSKKGDYVIQTLGRIINKWSTTKAVARIGWDQFVAISRAEDRQERLENIFREFDFQYKKFGMTVNVGIYPIKDSQQDIHAACDLAKVACDSIKNARKSICVYDEELSKRLKISNYVIQHLDEAIEKEYIQVYYQPVVRTLTNCLCGAEALARWIDPVLGFLPPGDFIPVLEDNHLITKLDLYILEKICQNIDRADQKEVTLVPISFNLSRMDFVDCDIFGEVEKIVKKYRVPRDLINIEITESMVMRDADIFTRAIAAFRRGGYQVWMDDFGSGYSSLNILENFQFDEIKLDMQFLQNFNESSKTIIRSIIMMAKNLGVQTLAEGVETKEQFDFLRYVGCEKVQGYYISKPLPLQEIVGMDLVYQNLVETRAWKNYYTAIGASNFVTDRALAVAEYDGKDISLCYQNDAFRNVLQEIGAVSEEMVSYNLNSPISPLSQQFRELYGTCRVGSGIHELIYSARGWFVRLRVKCLAENNSRTAYEVEISNLSNAMKQHDQVDQLHREMGGLFDMVCQVDLNSEQIAFVRQGDYLEQTHQQYSKNVKGYEGIMRVATSLIHPKDQAAYLAFINPYTLKDRIEAEKKSYLTGYFRTKTGNGAYIWKAHAILYNSLTNQAIYCSRAAALLEQDFVARILPDLGVQSLEPEQNQFLPVLRKGMRESQTISIFWKDTERRFLGANDNFLRIYGFQNVSEIIGKTDEDMQWHVDEGPFAEDERRVLQDGEVIKNRLGSCIIRGIAHKIIASKEPLYSNGKIVGLLGSFLVVDDVNAESGLPLNPDVKDPLTGLMSAIALTDLITRYVESYRIHHENFAVLRLSLSEYFRVAQSYGDKAANAMLRRVGELIVEKFGMCGSAARLYGGNFVVLAKSRDKESIRRIVGEILQELEDIHELAGYAMTLNPTAELYFADEVQDMNKMMGYASGATAADLAERRQLEERLSRYNLQMNTIVDAIPGGIAIHEILEDGNLKNVYASAGVARLTGRTTEEFGQDMEEYKDTGMVLSDVAYVNHAVREAMRNNQSIDVSYRLFHKDGYIVWINMKGRIIGEQNGHPLLLAVFQSISENNRSFEMALDEAMVGVIVNGIENNEILYENEAVKRIVDRYFDGDIYTFQNEIDPEWREEAAKEFQEDSERKYEKVCRGRHLYIHIFKRIWNGRKANMIYLVDNTVNYAAFEEVVTALSKDFLNVFQLNTRTGNAQTIKLEGHVTDGMEDNVNVSYPFRRIVERYTRERVLAEDRPKVLEALSAEGIEKNMRGKDEYSMSYRIFVDGELHTFQAKIVRRDQSHNYILAFQNIDSLVQIQNMNDQLRETVDRLPGAVVVFKRDQEGRLYREYTSALARAILGNEDTQESQKKQLLSYIHPEDKEWATQRIVSAGEAMEPLDITYRILDRKKAVHWLHHASNAVPQPDGTCLFYVIYNDVTSEKKIEMERRATLTEQYGEYFKQSFDAADTSQVLAVADLQGAMLTSIANAYVSMHIVNLEDRTFMKILCRDYVDKVLQNYKDAQKALDEIQKVLVKQEFQEEAKRFFDLGTLPERLKGKKVLKFDYSGNVTGWCRGHFVPVTFREDGLAKEVLFMVQYIQTEKIREETLRRASEMDGLSQLYNHIAGKNYVDDYLQNNGLGTFCLLDIDKFKSINDNYGHVAGDKVICAISQCMKKVFRSEDILIRLGGDEFGIFAPGLVDETACERRLNALNRIIDDLNFEEFDSKVTVSLGAVIRKKPEDYTQFEQMYQAADRLMYQHKRAKREQQS